MKEKQFMKLNSRMLVVVALAATLAGCTMAPKYERPAAPVPTEWPAGKAYDPTKISSEGVTDVQNLKWKDFFTDANLQRVIGIALENNLDLKASALNVQYYRQLYNIQRDALLPTINGSLSASRQRVPADLSGVERRITSERYDANLGVASWEIDFFGRIRSQKDSAMESYLATEQAHRAAQISLVSAVAQAYLSYAADHESLTIAEDMFSLYTDTYNKVKRTFDLGLTTEMVLAQSLSQVAASQRSVALYTEAVAKDKNALDLLLGVPIPEELLPANLTEVQAVREISAGLSSEALLNRPDILQAENQLKAANADIGAARASFFPRISLTAALGSASADLDGLFKGGSGYWSYAPQLVLPIFDPRTWASHRASKVQKEIMINKYEKAIQSAFRDVADCLASLGTIDQQVKAQEDYVALVKKTYDLSEYRFQKQIDNYLNVLDAQRSYRTAQQALVILHLQKRVSEIQFYAVLGGGWVQEEPATEPENRDEQLAQNADTDK